MDEEKTEVDFEVAMNAMWQVVDKHNTCPNCSSINIDHMRVASSVRSCGGPPGWFRYWCVDCKHVWHIDLYGEVDKILYGE